MLGRWLARRSVARVALFGLAIGMIALAGLSVWSMVQTSKATAQVERFNEISAHWNTVFVQLRAEDAALDEFLTTRGSDYARQPLIDTIGSAEESLKWLERNGGSLEANHVNMLRMEYEQYTNVVKAILGVAAAGGDLAGYEDLADLDFSQIRDQVVANVERKQRELAAYLVDVRQRNTSLGLIALAVAVVDLSFCAVSTAVLAVNQRLAERAAAKSRHQALHDPLTTLANRHLLAEHTNRAINEARRKEGMISLLLIDLDRFKQVNDTLGHHCGDVLLQRVAERMAMTARDSDVVARLGGDEFAVLLSSLDSSEDVPVIAERIRSAIEEPVELEGCWVDVGASVGASIFPIDCEDGEELLKHADAAMYTAKRGRLGVSVYNPDGEHAGSHGRPLLYELRREVERGTLIVHYQPRIDLRTMEVTGVEALVRWMHPTRGLLMPEAFLSLIEHSEFMERLTEAVLHAAASQAHKWMAAGHPRSVSVNIAERSLLDPDFPTLVARVIEEFGLPPLLLTLELHETVLTSGAEEVAEAVRALRTQGVRVSIDGFGSGASSMALLRDLPVHEVKLDRGLIGRVCADDRDRAVIRATLDLARNLALNVVAVGVEDGDTLSQLAELGCDAVQGYLISRPLPAAELNGWLDRWTPEEALATLNRQAPASPG